MKKLPHSTQPFEFEQAVTACACFNLRRASRVMTQHFDNSLKPSGLLVTQFTILAAVAIVQSITINELAEILVMDRTTLTRSLKLLERENWLMSEPGQDQRTRVISLTTEGEAILTKALPLWKLAQNKVAETLGQPRMDAMLADLTETTALMR
jgi:DNA-binding MarR family transcriptional regulator